MNNEDVIIRVASTDDAEALLDIYAPYVKNTAITFECEVPTLEQFRQRIHNTLAKYPYIVAERGGEILGYAYTGAFKGRAAYDWAVEASIYLRPESAKQGIGKLLYATLEAISREQNILNINACVAYPDVEDERLTKNSVQFHLHIGYEIVGMFHKCGYKLGTWYNSVWMEKLIGTHEPIPSPVISFPSLSIETLRALGVQ